MALKGPKYINTSDLNLNRVQDNMVVAFAPLSQKELIDGQIIKGILIGTGDTTINHKLGRQYIGYVVIKRNANSVVYDSGTVNNNKDKFIILKASATVTVDMWVF